MFRRPEKHVRSYMTFKEPSRKPTKFLPLLVEPVFEKEREKAALETAEIRLAAKREEYKQKRTDLDAQWQVIADRAELFKKNFEKFNTFVLENAEKRTRVQSLLEEHKKFRQASEKKVEELQGKIQAVMEHLHGIQTEVNKHQLYEKFLGSVVDAATKQDGFLNAGSIVEKYEFFSEMNTEIGERQKEDFGVLQTATAKLNQFSEVNQDNILGLHTQVAGLEGSYEDAIRRTRHLEMLIYRIKNNVRRLYNEKEIVKESVWNLYKLMCAKKNMAARIRKEDFEKQLVFISRTLRQYEHLRAEIENVKRKMVLKPRPNQ